MANWFLNFFPDRVLLLAWASYNSVCTQGCLWTPYPPPVSISQILRLQVWTNTPGFVWSWGSTPELHASQASTLATKLSFPTKKILSYDIHTLTYTHTYIRTNIHTYIHRQTHTQSKSYHLPTPDVQITCMYLHCAAHHSPCPSPDFFISPNRNSIPITIMPHSSSLPGPGNDHSALPLYDVDCPIYLR